MLPPYLNDRFCLLFSRMHATVRAHACLGACPHHGVVMLWQQLKCNAMHCICSLSQPTKLVTILLAEPIWPSIRHHL